MIVLTTLHGRELGFREIFPGWERGTFEALGSWKDGMRYVPAND